MSPGDQAEIKSRFEDAYDLYLDKLMAYAVFKVNDRALAQDLVQEAFVSYLNALNDRRDVPHPRAYLYASVANIAAGLQRQKRVHDSHLPRIRERGLRLCGVDNDPGAQERLQSVLNHMNSLPAEQREALELKYFHKLTAAEIGRIAGCSEHTAASRCKLAIEKLRHSIRDEA